MAAHQKNTELLVCSIFLFRGRGQDKTNKIRQDKTRQDKTRQDTTRQKTTQDNATQHNTTQDTTRHDNTRYYKTRRYDTRLDKTRADLSSVYCVLSAFMYIYVGSWITQAEATLSDAQKISLAQKQKEVPPPPYALVWFLSYLILSCLVFVVLPCLAFYCHVLSCLAFVLVYCVLSFV